MSKYFKFLFSMSFMGTLLIIFGVSIGVATFIENDFGTAAAKTTVYNATWFEVLMTLMVINMVGVIFARKLYHKSKISQLLFHVAFIIILIGAGITRFIGFEGMMHIREGATSNVFVSDNTFVQVEIGEGDDQVVFRDKVMFSALSRNAYNKTIENGDQQIKITTKAYVPNATQVLDEVADGSMYLTIVTAGANGRQDKYLKEGDSMDLGGVILSFMDTTTVGAVHIIQESGLLKIRSPWPVQYLTMATQESGELESGIYHDFKMRQLHTIQGVNFVLTQFTPNGKMRLIPNPDKERTNFDVVAFEISDGNQTQEVLAYGGKGFIGTPSHVDLGDAHINISYGSQLLELPFTVELRDFQLERYPGSESPASFASEVVLRDPEADLVLPYRIYMNNILQYQGYRFYQSSYDQDELGTVLSVNHDRAGTIVSYIGYLILAIGLISVFFAKNTRFSHVSKMIGSVRKKRQQLVVTAIALMLMVSFPTLGQDDHTYIDKSHAESFGKLLYQKNDGRMVPMNTMSSDLVRKVTKKSSWGNLTPDQVFLGMASDPGYWQGVEMIKVKNDEIREILGVSGDYASFKDFLDASGQYKLRQHVETAYAKNPGKRNQFDKDVINVDERANICFLAYSGSFLRVFPIPGDLDNKWVTPVDELQGIAREDSLFIKGVFVQYFTFLEEARETGDYTNADFIVTGIGNYQNRFGTRVMPSQTKLKAEILYNKVYLFKRLFPYYTTVGFGLLILLFVELFNPAKEFKKLKQFFSVLIMLGFGMHTIGLIVRWYVSGHAPWSNGFESMIYIAWTALLAGLIFRQKSIITLAVTSILAGIILMVAHLSWMDPEITNLVPVLRSYWLTIHVSCITASYGFLGLGALLAFLSLIIMILKNSGNAMRLDLTIQELSYITEMTLTVGLVLLVIGNFLGGVWANESWGRYWGWDPKETWALATIIAYSFILHMRFIPGLKGFYAFNFASVIGFSSVLMTYFGVNFYLSGLHSYAKGDPVPIPTFVYYTLGVIAVVSILAYVNDKRNQGNSSIAEAS